MISLEAFRLLGLVALGTLVVCAVILAVGAIWGLVLAVLSGAGEGSEEIDPPAPPSSHP